MWLFPLLLAVAAAQASSDSPDLAPYSIYFKEFDQNKDGELDAKEFGQLRLSKEANKAIEEATEEQRAALLRNLDRVLDFARFDGDGSGGIDLPEFERTFGEIAAGGGRLQRGEPQARPLESLLQNL